MECKQLNFVFSKLIRLGEYDTSQEGPDCNKVSSGGIDCTDGVTRIPIQKIIPHPDHISALYNHDIALVRMTQIAPFTGTVTLCQGLKF